MELTDDEIKAIKKFQGTGTLKEEWLKRPMYPSEWKSIFGELPKEHKVREQEPCEDCVSRHAVNVLVDELARAISDERCFLSRGRSTASIMQDILDLPSVTPQSKIVETGWGELFLLDEMSRFIKKEMDELIKSPWAQDKTLTPHDMAVKEAFAMVKDLILSKFEIKEEWENLMHDEEDSK